MASGTIKNTFRTGFTLQLKWSETATSVSANTSTVKVEAQLVAASGHHINSSVAKSIKITCDGTTKSATCYVGISSGQTKTLTTQTFTVKHNANGTKTAAISCTLGIEVTLGGTWYGSVSASGNAALTALAQTPSAPTSVTSTGGNGSFLAPSEKNTVSWSGASGTITGYDVQYRWDGGSWTNWSFSGTGTSTSYTCGASIKAGRTLQWRVRAKNGSLTSAWKESNTLTISGAMKLKVSGAWKTGSIWIKVNGSWKRAKRVWIKVNGTWKQSK